MLTIGRLVNEFHVTVDTVRHYEREGLLAAEGKTNSGYRLYGQNALRRMNFIKHAQQCGFTLAEIRQFVMLRTCNDACCKDVRQLAVEKAQLDARITALGEMSAALASLISMCTDGNKPLDECPLFSALEHAERSEATNARTRSRSSRAL